MYVNMSYPLFVTNCVFEGNDNTIESESYGNSGALHMGGSVTNATVVDSVFRGNMACSSGGAVYVGVGTNIYAVPTPVVLRNCLFEGNAAKSGGAVTLVGKGAYLLEDCAFRGNYVVAPDSQGGALRLVGSSTTAVARCSFEGNVAKYGGAASLCQGGGAFSFTNCVFASNLATNYGGAVSCDSSNFTDGGADGKDGVYGLYGEFFGCVFTNNVAWNYGGAFFLRDSQKNRNSTTPLTLRNSLFAGNRVTTDGSYHGGGAIYLVSQDNPVVDACTVVGNNIDGQTSTQAGAGIYHRWTGTIVNTIIAYNTLNGELETGKDWIRTRASHTCAYPASSNASSYLRDAEGCVRADPCFLDVSAGNYGLAGNSPCKHAGLLEDWMSDACDLAGNVRVFGSAPDMGCYERVYPIGTMMIMR